MRLWPFSNREEVRPGNFFEYNHCHNPEDGKFCSAPGRVGGGGPQRVSRGRVMTPLDRARAVLKRNDPTTEATARAVIEAMGPEFEAALKARLDLVPDAQAHLQQQMSAVAREIGATEVPYPQVYEGEGMRTSVGTVKGLPRTVEKIVVDYKGQPEKVKDLVRATIAVDSLDHVRGVRKAVMKHFDVIENPKDRFISPTDVEYRDVLVRFRAPNGLIGEIQIHAKPILKAKETVVHKLYAEQRSGVTKRRDGQLRKQMRAVFSQAWKQAVAMTVALAAGAAAKGGG